MTANMINVGFGNSLVARRILAILSPNGSPVKRLRDEAREDKRLIDATQGRRTRSVLITDTNHVILSSVQPETLVQRMSSEGNIRERDLQEE